MWSIAAALSFTYDLGVLSTSFLDVLVLTYSHGKVRHYLARQCRYTVTFLIGNTTAFELLRKEAWHFSAKWFTKAVLYKSAGPPEASRQGFRQNALVVVAIVVVAMVIVAVGMVAVGTVVVVIVIVVVVIVVVVLVVVVTVVVRTRPVLKVTGRISKKSISCCLSLTVTESAAQTCKTPHECKTIQYERKRCHKTGSWGATIT
jgi:hypothetical protein